MNGRIFGRVVEFRHNCGNSCFFHNESALAETRSLKRSTAFANRHPGTQVPRGKWACFGQQDSPGKSNSSKFENANKYQHHLRDLYARSLGRQLMLYGDETRSRVLTWGDFFRTDVYFVPSWYDVRPGTPVQHVRPACTPESADKAWQTHISV